MCLLGWHGLCWRSDKEPHNLIHEAIVNGLSDEQCAEKLSIWAVENFGLSASHPAGKDELGNPNKKVWPPPEVLLPLLQKMTILCTNFSWMSARLKKPYWKTT